MNTNTSMNTNTPMNTNMNTNIFVNDFVNDFINNFVNNFVNDFDEIGLYEIGRFDEIIKKFKCVNDFDKIGRSGEIIIKFCSHFDEIVIKFKNKSVVLSWVYLQPFCSTFFS